MFPRTLAQGMRVDLLYFVPLTHREQLAGLLSLAPNLLEGQKWGKERFSISIFEFLGIPSLITYILRSTSKQKLESSSIRQLIPFGEVRHRVLLTPAMDNLLRDICLDIRSHAPGVPKVLALGQAVDWLTHFVLSRLINDRVAIPTADQSRTSSDFRGVCPMIVAFLCGVAAAGKHLVRDHIVHILIARELWSLPQQSSAVRVQLRTLLQDNLWDLVSRPQLTNELLDVRLLCWHADIVVQVEYSLWPVPLHVL